MKLKRIEGILMKLIIIQFIFLLFFQLVFHKQDSFLEVKRLAQYEGVYFDNHSVIMDVFNEQIQK